MSRPRLTLTDVIVIVAVLVFGAALLLPTLYSCGCRSTGYGAQCLNNIRQLAIALNQFHHAHGRFPNSGTWASEMDITNNTTGGASFPGGPDDPAVNDIRWDYPLSNWVVDILPFIEHQDLADRWKQTERRNDRSGDLALFDEPDRSSGTPVWDKQSVEPRHYGLGQYYLALLVCPTDDSIRSGRGNLSYAVNGGPVLFWQWPVNNAPTPARMQLAGTGAAADDMLAAQRLGLLYPGSRHGNTPWDVRRTLASITDGASTTILIGENHRTGYVDVFPSDDRDPLFFGRDHEGAPGRGLIEGTWANPDPRFAAFHVSDDFCTPHGSCATGQSVTVTAAGRSRLVRRADWSKVNSVTSVDNQWGLSESINNRGGGGEGWTYLTSLHPGFVCIAMCDGSARFLSQDIDGEVLVKLVSPAGGEGAMPVDWPVHQSPLKDEEGF
jgi:hypothetical protein